MKRDIEKKQLFFYDGFHLTSFFLGFPPNKTEKMKGPKLIIIKNPAGGLGSKIIKKQDQSRPVSRLLLRYYLVEFQMIYVYLFSNFESP